MWLDASFVPNAIVMVTLPQPSLVGSHKRNTAHVLGIRAEPYVTTQPHAQMHRHTDGRTDRQTDWSESLPDGTATASAGGATSLFLFPGDKNSMCCRVT